MRVLLFALAVSLVGLTGNQTAPAQEKEPTYEGKTISEWIAQLKGNDLLARQDAAEALAKFGPNTRTVVAPLTELLKDKDPNLRVLVAYVLFRIGPPAKDAIPALAATLSDSNADVAGNAANALGAIGRDSLPALGRALKDKEWAVRWRAAKAVRTIAEKEPAAVPLLLRILNDDDCSICLVAVDGVLKADPLHKEAQAALRRWLKDSSSQNHRCDALRLLNEHKKATPSFVPALAEALKDEDKEVR